MNSILVPFLQVLASSFTCVENKNNLTSAWVYTDWSSSAVSIWTLFQAHLYGDDKMKVWWKWDREEDWGGHLYLSTKQKPFPAGADWYISHAIICYLILTDRSGGWAAGVQRGPQSPSWPGQTPPPSEKDMVDPASQWKIRPTTARQGPTGGGRRGGGGSGREMQALLALTG